MVAGSARLFVPLAGLRDQLPAGVDKVAAGLLQHGAALTRLARKNHALRGPLPALLFRGWRVRRLRATISHYALEAMAGRVVVRFSRESRVKG